MPMLFAFTIFLPRGELLSDEPEESLCRGYIELNTSKCAFCSRKKSHKELNKQYKFVYIL